MDYLLDTNACIALINGTPAAVRTRFQKVIAGGAQVYVSSVVTYELWYGVAKSGRAELNRKRLETYLAGPVMQLSFEEADARVVGTKRGAVKVSGKTIGAYDLLIAGQASARNLTLVTANVSEFARVKGLSWQDWARS